jgi:hypothetical protein
VHIQESEDKPAYICEAKRLVAIDLAPYYLKAPLRVYGEGRWFRDDDGEWIMKRFTIRDFKPLKDERLSDSLKRLRGLRGLSAQPEAISDLLKMRHGETKETA